MLYKLDFRHLSSLTATRFVKCADWAALFLKRSAFLKAASGRRTPNYSQNILQSITLTFLLLPSAMVAPLLAQDSSDSPMRRDWSITAPCTPDGVAEYEQEILKLYPEPKYLKHESFFFTADRLAIARQNAKKYRWAGDEVKQIVDRADEIMAVPVESIIKTMPAPNMIRKLDGPCPYCGPRGKNSLTTGVDVFLHPWKMKCRNCGNDLPGFDAQAYFLSGKISSLFFDTKAAKESLLPEDPDFRKLAVEVMQHYCMVYWHQLGKGVHALTHAYVFTGKPEYARRALVLITRFADIYPYFRRDDTRDDTHTGAMVQDGSEAVFMQRLALDYDVLWPFADDPDVLKSVGAYRKACTLPALKDGISLQQHLEGRIFGVVESERSTVGQDYMRRIAYFNPPREFIAPEVIGAVFGNTPLGVAFQKEAERFAFKGFHRDGSNVEGGLSYDIGGFRMLAYHWTDTMRFCVKPPQNLLHDASVLSAYDLYYDLYCLDRFYPLFGDTGICGSPNGCFAYPSRTPHSLDKAHELNKESAQHCAIAFHETGMNRLARMAWHLNGNSAGGLHLSIFDRNPENISVRIRQAVDAIPYPLKHSFAAPYLGMAVLRSGEGSNQRALWLRANRQRQTSEFGWHGHNDSMNIGLSGFGLNLLPELGYMDQKPWIYGHNAVSVQNTPAPGTDKPRSNTPDPILTEMASLCEFPSIQVISCRGTEYPSSARTVALVDVDKDSFYVVDSVRVSPDVPQKYATVSFHSNQGDVHTTLKWTKADKPIEGVSRVSGRWLPPLLEADSTQIDQPWSAEIALDDTYGLVGKRSDIKLRFMALRSSDHVFQTAYAPPDTSPVVPKRIPYLMLSNARADDSGPRRFSAIIEPFRKHPSVRDASAVQTEADVDVIKVAQSDDRIRVFIIPDNRDEPITLSDGTRMHGDLAVITRNGKGTLTGISLKGKFVETAEGVTLLSSRANGEANGGFEIGGRGRVVVRNRGNPLKLKIPEGRNLKLRQSREVELHQGDGSTFCLLQEVADENMNVSPEVVAFVKQQQEILAFVQTLADSRISQLIAEWRIPCRKDELIPAVETLQAMYRNGIPRHLERACSYGSGIPAIDQFLKYAGMLKNKKKPPEAQTLYRINCGASKPFTDASGNVWMPDQRYLFDINFYGYLDDAGYTYRGPIDIQKTSTPEIYRTERFGLDTFRLLVPNGKYTVRLHFAETWKGRPGVRVMDVAIEDKIHIKGIAPFDEAGFQTACIKEAEHVEVSDGRLDIEFSQVKGQPEINAIEVLKEE